MPTSLHTAFGHAPAPAAATVGDTPELEIALLRRTLRGSDKQERCGSCDRHLLIGERVYEYASGELCCPLCRQRASATPAASHLVHGPAFGTSLRLLNRRAA